MNIEKRDILIVANIQLYNLLIEHVNSNLVMNHEPDTTHKFHCGGNAIPKLFQMLNIFIFVRLVEQHD